MALMAGWTHQRKKISKLTDRAIEIFRWKETKGKMSEKNNKKNLRSICEAIPSLLNLTSPIPPLQVITESQARHPVL